MILKTNYKYTREKKKKKKKKLNFINYEVNKLKNVFINSNFNT
jgi:hypothetical protein